MAKQDVARADAMKAVHLALIEAGSMEFAISMLHEKLEDCIMARCDKDDQGLFVAMGACLQKLGSVVSEAMQIMDDLEAAPDSAAAVTR